jgi:uncharacterized protein
MDFLNAFWSTTQELAPWLFVGAILSALLHVLLPPDFISKKLTGMGGIFRAVFLGVPLPLCSCGVIPAGIGLKKDGASDGASIAFLISTPQTGIDSVFVSTAFLGLPFAIFKLLSATVTGLVGGLLVQQYGGDSTAPNGLSSKLNTKKRTWADGLDHGVQLIRSIWRWLLFGVILSAVLQTLVPESVFASLQHLGVFGAAIAALLISIPLYVCATASVPIAAALVQAGLPLGAALVFLMAGPATNVATIGAIRSAFGNRTSIIYLSTVIVGSISLGLGFEALFSESLTVTIGEHHMHAAWWQSLSGGVLFAFFFLFAFEEFGPKSRITSASTLEFDLEGLHCGGCVSKAQKAIEALPGIESVQVTLSPQKALIVGSTSADLIIEAVRTVGFSAVLKSEQMPLSFTIEGMTCGGCVSKLRRNIEAVEGAFDVSVSLEPPTLQVSGLLPKDVKETVQNSGFSIREVAV